MISGGATNDRLGDNLQRLSLRLAEPKAKAEGRRKPSVAVTIVKGV